MLPNLIGCGAGKSGTTSLYHYLNQHPQICMAAAKEVHFFTHHFEKGREWYESQFLNCDEVPILGEFSTSYMLDPEAPKRMAELLPAVRLLFIFRDPVERAYSNYWFSRSIGTLQTEESFSEVIRSPLGHEKFVSTGFYYQHLERFFNYFDREQIYVFLTEELKVEPVKQMQDFYQYLGVDARFQPDTQSTYNVTVVPTNKLAKNVYQGWFQTKQRVKPLFKRAPSGLRSKLSLMEKRVINTQLTQERPQMSSTDQEYLSQVYAEDVENLTEYLGRRPPWLS